MLFRNCPSCHPAISLLDLRLVLALPTRKLLDPSLLVTQFALQLGARMFLSQLVVCSLSGRQKKKKKTCWRAARNIPPPLSLFIFKFHLCLSLPGFPPSRPSSSTCTVTPEHLPSSPRVLLLLSPPPCIIHANKPATLHEFAPSAQSASPAAHSHSAAPPATLLEPLSTDLHTYVQGVSVCEQASRVQADCIHIYTENTQKLQLH